MTIAKNDGISTISYAADPGDWRARQKRPGASVDQTGYGAGGLNGRPFRSAGMPALARTRVLSATPAIFAAVRKGQPALISARP